MAKATRRQPGRFEEIGVSGLHVYGGFVNEEFLKELNGDRGRRKLREMADNDATIGAVLNAIGLTLRSVIWEAVPAEDAPEEAAKAEAEFVESIFDDMSHTWDDFLTEVLSFLVFGWSYHEIVLKRRVGPYEADPSKRSEYTDGRIGVRKLPTRAQETLLRWELQDDGGIAGLWQVPPNGGETRYVPIERALLFRTVSNKNNPEGKALALDTPILTKDGWKTMGTVAVGDAVFAADGRLTYVSEKSPVWHDRECFEVCFNSGETIISDAEHLWSVSSANDRNHTGRPPRVLSTREIYEKFKSNKTACLSPGLPTATDQPRQWLPLDPYVLGYWLGDGDTQGGGITVHKDDWDSLRWNVEAAGFDVTFDGDKRAYVKGLLPKLRQAGVYKNKHIPDAYLRGSVDQRIALLQGLMDSDGSSPVGRRPSYFCNSKKALIDGFIELVSSLGAIPMRTSQCGSDRPNKKINGVPIKRSKTAYRVSFWAPFAAHRLKRKAAAQTYSHVSDRMGRFFIRDIRPAERHDTVCIEVSNSDHLFLVGKTLIPTHNSIIRNAYESWYFLRHIRPVEATGIERELAGLPVVKIPARYVNATDGADLTVLNAYKKVARDLKFNEQGGLVIPSDMYPDVDGNPSSAPLVSVDLLKGGGQRAIDTNAVKMGYKQDIANSVLAGFILLGSEGGSYALSKDKSSFFLRACEAILSRIESVINRFLIPRIWDLNGLDRALMPEYRPGRLAAPDLGALGSFVQQLAAAGAPLFPDTDLENRLREDADLPPVSPEAMEYREEENAAATAAAEAAMRGAVEPADVGDAGNGDVTKALPQTLYVRRDVLNADEIRAWAKSQGLNATLPADDMHVTIAYSKTPVDWMKMGTSPDVVAVMPGGMRFLELFGEEKNALVLGFTSKDLSDRHAFMCDQGASWDWPDYQPHITITYHTADVDVKQMQAYPGLIILGPEVFERIEENWQDKIEEVSTS